MSLAGSAASMDRSQSTVSQLYMERRKIFIKSLQDILKSVSQDLVVRQLLQEQTSSQFVSQRLEELIIKMLSDKREDYIDDLVRKILKYENFIDMEKAELIKILGDRIVTVSDQQMQTTADSMRYVHTLIEHVKALQEEVSTLRTGTEIAIPEKSISSISKKSKMNFDDPSYLHVFAEIDLSDLSMKLKNLQTDMKTVKKFAESLKRIHDQTLYAVKRRVLEIVVNLRRRTYTAEKKLKEEREKINSLQNKLTNETIPEMISRHEATEAALKDDLAKAKSDLSEAKRQLQDRESTIRTLKKQQRQIMSVCETLKQQNSSMQEELTKLRTDGFQKDATLSTQTAQFDELNRQIEQLKQENATMQKIMEKAHGKLLRQKERANAAVAELQAQRRDSENKVRQAAETKHDNEELQRLLGEAHRQIKAIRRENAQLKKDQADSAKEAEEERIKAFNAQKALSQQQENIRRLNKQLAGTEKENNDLQEQIHNLGLDMKELDRLKAALSETKASKDSFEATLAKAEEKIGEETEAREKAEKGLKEMEKRLNSIRGEARSIIQEKDALKKQLDSERDKIKALENQLRTTNDKLVRYNAEKEDLENAFKNLEGDNDTTKQQFLSHRKLVDEQARLIAELQSENEDLHARLQTADELAQKRHEKVKEYKQGKAEAESKIEQATQEKDAALKDTAASKRQLEQTQQELKEINDKLAKEAEEKEALQVQLSQRDDEIDKLSKQNDKNIGNNEKLQKELSDATTKLEKANVELQTLIQKQAALNNAIEQANNEKRDAVQASQEMEHAKDKLERELAASQEVINSKDKQFKDDEEEIAKLHQKIEGYERLQQKAKKENAELSKRLKEATDDADHMREELSNKINELKSQVNESRRNEAKLNTQLKDASNANDELQRKVKKSHDDANKLKSNLNGMTDDLVAEKKKVTELEMKNKGTEKALQQESKKNRELTENINKIAAAMNVDPNSDLSERAKKLAEEASILNDACNEWDIDPEDFVEKIKKAKKEHENLLKTLNLVDNEDICKAIEKLIDEKHANETEGDRYKEFAEKLLDIVNEKPIEIPETDVARNRILRSVEEGTNKAKSNKEACDSIVQKASERGYSGNDPIAACDFLIRNESENISDELEKKHDADITELKKSHNEVMDQLQNEINELKEAMKSEVSKEKALEKKLNDTNADLSQQLQESEMENKKINGQLTKANNDLTEAKKRGQDLQSQLDLLQSQLDSLGADKNSTESELNGQLKKATSALQNAQNENSELRQNLAEESEKLQKAEEDFRSVLAALHASDAPSAIAAVKKLDIANNILKQAAIAIGVEPEEVVDKCHELSNDSNVLATIKNAAGCETPESTAAKVKRVFSDRARVADILKVQPDDNLVQYISNLVDNLEHAENDLNDTKDALHKVLDATTGNPNPTWFAYPIDSERRDKAIKDMAKRSKQAQDDRKAIEKLLSEAADAGYEGDDILEAANAIKEKALGDNTKKYENTLNTNEKEHDDQVQELNDNIEELKNEVSSVSKARDKEAKAAEELRGRLETLSAELAKVKEELIEASDDAEKNKRQLGLTETKAKSLETSLNEQTQRANNLDALLSKITGAAGVYNTDDLVPSAEKHAQSHATLKTVCRILGCDPGNIVALANQLKQEHNHIKDVLGGNEENPDLCAAVDDLVATEQKEKEQLTDNTDFLNRLLNVVSDSPIPLNRSDQEKERFIAALAQQTKLAKEDRENAEDIVAKARAFGYSGDDTNEAADFIVSYECGRKDKEAKLMKDALDLEIEELKEKLEAATTEHIQSCKKMVEGHKAELQKANDSAEEEKEVLRKDLEGKLEALQKELAKEKAQHKKDIEDANEEHANEIEKINDEHNKAINKAKEEHEKEVESIEKSKEDQEKEMSNQIETMKKNNEDMMKEKNNEIEKLNEQVKEQKEEKDELEKKLEYTEEGLKQSKKKGDELENKIQHLEEQLDSLMSDKSSSETALLNQQKKLHNSLEESQNKCAELKDKLMEENEKLQKTENDLHALLAATHAQDVNGGVAAIKKLEKASTILQQASTVTGVDPENLVEKCHELSHEADILDSLKTVTGCDTPEATAAKVKSAFADRARFADILNVTPEDNLVQEVSNLVSNLEQTGQELGDTKGVLQRVLEASESGTYSADPSKREKAIMDLAKRTDQAKKDRSDIEELLSNAAQNAGYNSTDINEAVKAMLEKALNDNNKVHQQEMEQKNNEHEEEVNGLNNKIEDLLAKSNDLSNDKADLNNKCDELEKELEKTRNNLQESENHSAELQGVIDKIASDIGLNGDEQKDIIETAAEHAKSHNIIQDLAKATGIEPEKLVEACSQNKKDLESIARLIASEDLNNLPDKIDKVLKEKDEINEENNRNRKFIEQLITGIIGKQANLKFPIPNNMQQQIIAVVERNIATARLEHKDIERLLNRASVIGYTGESIDEAATAIADHAAKVEGQQVMDRVRDEIDSLKDMLDKEIAKRKASNDDNTKKTREFQRKILELTETMHERERQAADEMDEVQRQLRELEAQLHTEKQLREELSRIGSGNAADMKLLKAKLSEKEFAMIQLIEGLIQKDKEGRELRESMKKARQESLSV